MTKENLINAIDEVLPQTQCGLCGYGACRPYAQALVDKNEQINLCPPGGTQTLMSLGAILKQDPLPFIDDIATKSKAPSRAVIREAECIGCTKCIQACPVDAILGSGKKMHTVIAQECTGCELCVEPCPVDCIDMIPITPLPHEEQRSLANQWRARYQHRQLRLNTTASVVEDSIDQALNRKTDIQQAMARARIRGTDQK
jgi:electron transport complex protein RnfB